MKTRRYTFLLFLCLGLAAFIQLHPNNKQKKVPVSKQISAVLNLNANQTLANINQRLSAFMKNAGVKVSSNFAPVNYQNILHSIAPGSGSKLPIPKPDTKNDKSIKNIVFDSESGTPRLLELNATNKANTKSVLSSVPATEMAMNFLNEKKSLLKISDPKSEFILKSEQKDELGMTHLRYTQTYKGLEVWGKEIYLHLDNRGNILMMNGRYEATPQAISDITERINGQNAISMSVNDLKNKSISGALSGQLKKILDYDGPAAKKVIWIDKNYTPHLAWHINVIASLSNNWEYFIDANSGKILNSYNTVCYDGAATGTGTDLNGDIRTFGTYQVGTDYYMIDASQQMFNGAQSKIPDEPVGAIVTLDLKNKDLSNQSTLYYVTSATTQWLDPTAISAQYNAVITYNYFQNIHNRNSIDDKGMTIYSITNVTESGKAMENAFWGGKVMCYGNGGTYFKPLAGALDVAAHEMTHGITQYSAGLEYQDQSGALNESWSDVFGVVVDSLNWTLGEHIVKDFSVFPSGALRDMADPHNGGTKGSNSWQPSKMSEFVNTTEDHGGVHLNSGIPNHAFYLTVLSLGRPKAAKIWYRALTNYLTRTSQFVDARIATEKSAADLYGAGSAEVSGVKGAWDGVEVFEGNVTPPPPPSSVIGEDWILALSTDPNDPSSLYRIKSTITSGADIAALTSTPILNRPSVSDTSGVVIFIDAQHNLRALYADPQNPQETILDQSGAWWSVAVGPGMNYIALTTIYSDTSIYYIDLVHNTSKAFKIAIQTYDAADVKTALYADALSFDPTGQYLLFDAYNEIKNASGDTLSYWNINLLNVNTGKMQSVFPPSSEGISVGNPAFSKTSPSRFTFDYYDSKKDEYYVLAMDFNTNTIGTVAGPLRSIGYPTYSGDDKAIAYHTIISEGQYIGHDGIEQMPLKEDMIEGTGSSTQYLVDATFPVWFVIGSRVTGVENEQTSTPKSYQLFQNYPNPFNPVTNMLYAIGSRQFVNLKVYDVLGNEVATLVNEEKEPGEYEVQYDASNLSSGVYFYKLSVGNPARGTDFTETKKMILLK